MVHGGRNVDGLVLLHVSWDALRFSGRRAGGREGTTPNGKERPQGKSGSLERALTIALGMTLPWKELCLGNPFSSSGHQTSETQQHLPRISTSHPPHALPRQAFPSSISRGTQNRNRHGGSRYRPKLPPKRVVSLPREFFLGHGNQAPSNLNIRSSAPF